MYSMNQREIVDWLRAVRPWRQFQGPARPSYLGDSCERLAWTRPILTYALSGHDFLSRELVS